MPTDEQYKTKWTYTIYGECYQLYDDGLRESDEWCDTEDEAADAVARAHIDKLESGES